MESDNLGAPPGVLRPAKKAPRHPAEVTNRDVDNSTPMTSLDPREPLGTSHGNMIPEGDLPNDGEEEPLDGEEVGGRNQKVMKGMSFEPKTKRKAAGTSPLPW